MPLAEFTRRIFQLAAIIHQWLGAFAGLDQAAREKVALYAEEIANTLQRAAAALARLDAEPGDRNQVLTAVRELGRVAGYLETIVGALERHLDGRKLTGVKRRLESLRPFDLDAVLAENGAFAQAERLSNSEGFFRALADALRT